MSYMIRVRRILIMVLSIALYYQVTNPERLYAPLRQVLKEISSHG